MSTPVTTDWTPQEGELVWVQCGEKYGEELATVLATDCPWFPSATDNDDDKEPEERQDGVQVRFQVSSYVSVYGPHDVRLFVADEAVSPSSGKQRRMTRSRRANTTTTNNNRSVVTPSPRNIDSVLVAATTPQKNNKEKTDKDDDDDEEGADSEASDTNSVLVKKPAAKRKRSVTSSDNKNTKTAKTVKKNDSKTAKKNNATAAATVAGKVKTAPKKKAAAAASVARRKTSSDSDSNTSSSLENETKKQTKKTTTIALAKKSAQPSDAWCIPCEPERGEAEVEPIPDELQSQEGEETDEELEDRPFKVEYAPTSQATCKSCDTKIQKQALRIAHVPMFRGRPGFKVYRHLDCAVFSEAVQQVSDVGGWRRLKAVDRPKLKARIESSHREREKEDTEVHPDELVQEKFAGEIRADPEGLVANVLPFQREGFSWMRHQEVHVPTLRGGILADEMGLGKTLQTILTILDHKPLLQHCRPGAKHPPSSPDLEARKAEEVLWSTCAKEWEHEMKMINIPKKMWPKNRTAHGGTLVICPMIALRQWKSEIEKFTAPGTLSVAIYHGPNREKELPLAKMQKYDVILTTYQVIEQEFRKMASPNKVTCPNCSQKLKWDKLRMHLTYFCGDAAQRTDAQMRQVRSRPRGGGRGGGANNRGGDGGKGKGKGGKKNFAIKTTQIAKKTATVAAPKAKQSKKIAVRSRRVAGYDTDSDLTVNEDEVHNTSRGRPSRSAAKTSSKKVASSVKEWGGDDDESSFASGDDGSDDEDDFVSEDESSSDDEPLQSLSKGSKKKMPLKRKKPSRSDDDTDLTGSDEDDPVARVREKQRQALANAKNKKATKPTSKPAAKSRGVRKSKSGKGKMNMKKFDSDSFSSSDDDNVTGKKAKLDPMAGIDLDELMNEAMSGARFSILHSVCWWRVVLDEAHYIKSRSSQTAAAAFSLSGINRWCLSGTPLQNRVGELYSLIRFLRIDPMAFYFCRQKGCDCKSIHYRIKQGTCQDCGHRAFSHFAHFNKFVLNVIQRDGYSGDGRRAMFKLKNEVLDRCLLRRTKETRAEDMNLPPRIVTIRPIRLHPAEEDFYNSLYQKSMVEFNDYVASGTLLNNYAHIFDLLTKMRQAVDHPYLIVYSKTNCQKKALAGESQTAEMPECELCHETPTERVMSSCCRAGFCRSCVLEYLAVANTEGSTPCPGCSSPFTIDLNQKISEESLDVTKGSTGATQRKGAEAGASPSLRQLSHIPSGSILRRIPLAEFATSTKIEVLIQELTEMRRQRPGSKALVFSQFVSMLDLVRWRIHTDPHLTKDVGLGVRMLHGGMDVNSRDAALKDFRESEGVRVMLMSLKAGGVALNLTVASEVYLLDNWWNPAAEMQAIDRTHRLGQYRPIRAVRFIAQGTVEERVLQLQEKKRLVFDGTVGRDAGSLNALSAGDLKALFT